MDEIEEEEIALKKRRRIPKRFLLLAMITYMTFSLYGSKHVIFYALTPFLKKPSVSVGDIIEGECNATSNATVHRYKHISLYGWKISLVGSLKSSYTWAYTISGLTGGVLADKFGGRRILLIAYLISSVWVGLCPMLIRFCGGYSQLIVAWNAINGLLQGCTVPAIDSMLGQWFPFGTRTTATSIKNAGFMYGLSTSVMLCDSILEESDRFDYPFYIWCGSGIFMCFLWYFSCFSSPEEHPTITEEERTMLREKLGPYVAFNKKKQIPWKKILTSLPAWAFSVNHVGLIWGMWSALGLLPVFLRNIAKIDTHHVNFTIVPTIILTITDLSLAVLCDYLIRNRSVDVSTARKIYANFGCMGCGIFAISMSYSACLQSLVTVLYIITITFFQIFITGVAVNSLDLAPNFAGVLGGFSLTFAVLFTYPGSYYVGSVGQSHDLSKWKNLLWFSFIGYAVGNLFYAVGCSGEEREWNIPQHLRKTSLSDTRL